MIILSCPAKQPCPNSGTQPQNPAQNPSAPQNPQGRNVTVGEPIAVCPRCGKIFPIDKPIKECSQCGLVLAEFNEDKELEWNERMAEPLPDFLQNPLAPDQIFAKTIEWYWKKWIQPHLENPSHKQGKVK